MGGAGTIRWTAEAVLERLAMDADTIPLGFDQDLWGLAESTFGAGSLRFASLVARAAARREGGPSVAELVRSRHLWRRSRASLYRWSGRAARDLAGVLRDGPPAPAITSGKPSSKQISACK